MFGRDWEFSLADIDVLVGIWHGEADRINPVMMARYLRDAIPTAEAFLYPDRGHVSIFVVHDREMFGWLTK